MTDPLFIMTINAFVQPNSRNLDYVVIIRLSGRQCVVWLHKIIGREQRRRINFPVYGMFEGGMSDEGSVYANNCGEGDGVETQHGNI